MDQINNSIQLKGRSASGPGAMENPSPGLSPHILDDITTTIHIPSSASPDYNYSFKYVLFHVFSVLVFVEPQFCSSASRQNRDLRVFHKILLFSLVLVEQGKLDVFWETH